MRAILVALGLSVAAGNSGAQSLSVVAGADVVRGAEYRGGHSSKTGNRKGMLVLDDSTLTLYACRSADCMNAAGTDWDRSSTFLSIPLARVQRLHISTARRGPSAMDKALLGAFAGDRNEGYVAVTYDVGGTVETPLFKISDAAAEALDQKIRYRAKKRGIDIAP